MKSHYRYRRSSKLPPDFLKKKATEILYEKMVFYDKKAKELYLEIKKVLKTGDASQRGDILAQMTKYLSKANDICIDCASKLAPYQSPRLQSMEVKKNVTHRFVIQAPKPAVDSAQWLEEADKPIALIESTGYEGLRSGADRIDQTNGANNGSSIGS